MKGEGGAFMGMTGEPHFEPCASPLFVLVRHGAILVTMLDELTHSLSADKQQLLAKLKAEGFEVALTPRRIVGARTHTLHVYWRGYQVAYLTRRLQSEKAILGYRFDPATARARNRCPEGFDLNAFAKQHDLDPVRDLRVREDGREGKSYLRALTQKAALRLMRASAQAANAAIAELDRPRTTTSGAADVPAQDPVVADVEDLLNNRPDLDQRPTTRQRLVEARLGQGEFREKLEQRFDSGCAVTGIKLREMLRASHTMSWAISSDEERLDGDNGLLLAAHLDALFDRHLITFERDGAIRIASRITADVRQLLSLLGGRLKQAPSPAQWRYLQEHNAVFQDKEQAHRESTREANGD